MQIATLIAIFIMVSLWEYCMFFRRKGALPYVFGFNFFSVAQWVIAGISLVHFYGWLYGIIILALCITLLQYVTHFTLGILYNLIFGSNPVPPLALFSLSVWVTGILTALSIFL